MSLELVVSCMFALIQGAFFLYLRVSITNQKATEKELSQHKLHVAESYVTKTEMKEHFERIEKSLEEVKSMITHALKAR